MTGARRHTRWAWGLIAVWLAAPAGVRAQPATGTAPPAVVPARPDPAAEARRQFMIGERLFQAGRYREAARAYQRGYRLSKRPGFLINIAHCQVRLGRPELAREHYHLFLAEAPEGPLRAEVTRALAELEAESGESKRQGARAPSTEVLGAQSSETQNTRDLASWRLGVATLPAAGSPALPLGARDQLHQPSAAEQALDLKAQVPAARHDPPRWLWPAVGVGAAAVVLGTFAVFAARGQQPALARGSIGTIRR